MTIFYIPKKLKKTHKKANLVFLDETSGKMYRQKAKIIPAKEQISPDIYSGTIKFDKKPMKEVKQ